MNYDVNDVIIRIRVRTDHYQPSRVTAAVHSNRAPDPCMAWHLVNFQG